MKYLVEIREHHDKDIVDRTFEVNSNHLINKGDMISNNYSQEILDGLYLVTDKIINFHGNEINFIKLWVKDA